MSTSDKIKTMEPRASIKLGRSATMKLDKPKRVLRAARKKAVEIFYSVKERLLPEPSLWLPNDLQAQYNEEWYGSRRAHPRNVHFGRHRDSLEVSRPEAVNKALRERFERECRNTLLLEMEGTRAGMFALY